MEDSDDELPTLSADTFAALQQFYKEEEHRESVKLSIQECTKPEDMTAFTEDWNLSQFWYDDQTSEILAKACVRGAGLTGKIACISAPTAYMAIRKHFPEAKAVLFEYDKRFATFGEDFVFYDYKSPLAVPKELGSGFDLVLADPPFLSDECLTKTAVTLKFLAKDKILLCTGAIMEEMAKRLLNLEKCKFEPRHKNNLANDFKCYANYDLDLSIE